MEEKELPVADLMTPERQKAFMKFGGDRTLLSILEDTELIKSFPPGHLPDFEIIDGVIFIKPFKHVHDVNIDNYFRFIPVTKNFDIISGHDYPFVELPQEGYLINISVPPIAAKYLKDGYTDFNVDYVIDINSIKLKNPDPQHIVGYYDNFHDEREADEISLLTPISIGVLQGSFEREFSDLNKFFKDYLEFMFDGLDTPIIE